MKATIQIDDLSSLSYKLRIISEELEDMISIYNQQMSIDSSFTGPAVDKYQRALNELLNEHQKTIEFYNDLSKQIIEIEKDFLSYEEEILERIENL